MRIEFFINFKLSNGEITTRRKIVDIDSSDMCDMTDSQLHNYLTSRAQSLAKDFIQLGYKILQGDYSSP